jgi:DNA-binding protein H-NS
MSSEKPPVDISKLSFSELAKLVKEAQGALQSKRGEELKVLADAYAKKLQASEFSIQEGIEALRPYVAMSPRKNRADGGTRSVEAKYRGPNGEEWSGRGRTPKWLAKLLESGEQIEKYRV